MSREVIKVENLTVRYNNLEVLSDLSFNVKSGDYIGIIGPNGSGKTTLVKAMLGLVESCAGDIYLFGKKKDTFKGWQKIGYLPQKAGFFDPQFPATAGEIVESGLLSQKRFPKRIEKSDDLAIDNVLGLLDVKGLKAKLIGRLSGGQQQRIFLARALVNKPEILILDEPTVALDPQTRENFYLTLERLNKKTGITVLLVSHDSGSIGKYASRLLYLDKRIIFYGSFDDFCKSREMTDYFGNFSQHIICHRHEPEA